MAIPAGHVMLAQEFAGFVAESIDTTSNNSGTTTEFVSTSITFTAFAGLRYKCTYIGNCESSIASDGMTLRLRWQNSASPGITGTQFAIAGSTADTVSHGCNVSLVGTFTGALAGSVTISATIVRNTGSGTVRTNATSNGGALYLLVECDGPA